MASAAPTNKSRTIVDLVPFTCLTCIDKKPIGSGAFGMVFKAVHSEWGCQVAYKKLAVHYIENISEFDEKLIQDLKYEAEIHRQLRHPNIVCMLGVVFEESNYGIILELITYGSWSGFLKSIKHKSEEMSCIRSILKIKLAHEISVAMSYLHNCRIIHCDLKLQNILIAEHIVAKISDFGLSKWKDYSRSHTNASATLGTPSHISPEQWSKHPPNDKTDVYSFSILLWEMFTEKQAFKGQRDTIRSLVISGERLSLDMLPRDVPQEIHSLIKSCWDQKATARPAFKDLTICLGEFIHGETILKEINDAKEIVLTIYHRRSGSVNVADVENSDHREKIRRVHQILCEFIRHPDQILSSLFEKKAVSHEEHANIASETNMYKWTRCLLKVLSVKPLAAYKCFLQTLDDTNQHHLYLLLENKGYKMNAEHKVTLIDNFTYLKDNITLTDSALLDTLLEMDVLDQQEVTEIKSKNTDHKRTDQLLQCIMRTSNEQYQQFLQALNKTSYQHVYIKLTVEDENRLNLYSFLDNPRLLGAIPDCGLINGLTVLHNQIFIVDYWSTEEVHVYDTYNLTLTRNIPITGSSGLCAIIASSRYNCLYISDTDQDVIYRYNLSENVISSWSVGEGCWGLSLTSTHNVLATLIRTKKLKEYTADGSLVREISLDSSIDRPHHSIQLSSDQFAVSHGDGRALRRVCIVDTSGRIIQCYGASMGSGIGQLIVPSNLAVDRHDNVLVVDCSNNRVVLLSPSMTHLGYIKIPGHTLDHPCALHLDLLTRRLYIGEMIGETGQVLVLTV